MIFASRVSAQPNRDAGIIEPFTMTAEITVSSGINPENVRDGKGDTFWESASALPHEFIGERDRNLFLDLANFDIVGNNNSYQLAFDGNTDSKAEFKANNTEIKLYYRQAIKFFSLKFNTTDTLFIVFHFEDNSIMEKVFTGDGNYTLHSIEIQNSKVLKSINLHSKSPYQIFELAALGYKLTEWVQFEFNEVKEIGYIQSRHLNWAGIDSIQVLFSNNGTDWNLMNSLNPTAVAPVSILVEPAIYTRFIKVNFYLAPLAYNKANLREFACYNRFGPFGKPAAAKSSNNSWSESFGINTIWGWGYGIPSVMLKNGKGAETFSSLSSQARSYHRLDWDIESPGNTPGFMEQQKQTDSLYNKWLNWKEEYSLWIKSSFSVDACILFNEDYFPSKNWTSAYLQAQKYGREFAEFFNKNNKLVEIIEVGNEPWEYNKSVYRDILNGMAVGIKSKTSELKVLPCGLQAFDKYSELNNYLPEFVTENTNIDGINTHIYSYYQNDAGLRLATNPEDPRSETWSVNNLKVWALANNFPNKIYVTEFGYDSDGGGGDCVHSNCVSELEQAIYGLRQAMILYRLGVEKFYWYFYADVDWESIMHNRSGLISAYKNGFQKKLSFHTFEFVYQNLGDLYFSGIVSENDDLYCYSFSDNNGNTKALVAWRPTLSEHKKTKWVEIPFSAQVKSISSVVEPDKSISYKRETHKLKIALSGVPVVVMLR